MSKQKFDFNKVDWKKHPFYRGGAIDVLNVPIDQIPEDKTNAPIFQMSPIEVKSDISKYDPNSLTYEENKQIVSGIRGEEKGGAPIVGKNEIENAQRTALALKAVEQVVSGEGELGAYFNPLMNTLQSSKEGIESSAELFAESAKALKEGDTAGAITGVLAGTARGAFAIATPLVPQLTAFTQGTKLAQGLVPDEALKFATQPVTTLTKPESFLGKNLAELGDLGAIVTLAYGAKLGKAIINKYQGNIPQSTVNEALNRIEKNPELKKKFEETIKPIENKPIKGVTAEKLPLDILKEATPEKLTEAKLTKVETGKGARFKDAETNKFITKAEAETKLKDVQQKIELPEDSMRTEEILTETKPVAEIIQEASKEVGERPINIAQKAIKIDEKVYDAPSQSGHKASWDKAKADIGETELTKAFDEGRISVMTESGEWQKLGEQKRFISEETYQESRKALNEKLGGQLGAIPDLSAIPEAFKVGAYHFENIVRAGIEKGQQFVEFSKEMIKEFGEKIKDFIQPIWDEVSKQVGGKLLEYAENKGLINSLEGKTFNEFQKTIKETPPEIREKGFIEELQRRHSISGKFQETKEGLIRSVKQTAKTVLEPISTSLEKIHPSLFKAQRRFEFDLNIARQKSHKIFADYLTDYYKAKIPIADEGRIWDRLANNDISGAKEIMRKYGIEDKFQALSNEVQRIGAEAKVNQIENYYPRMVRDYKGLSEYLSTNFPEYNNIFRELIAKKEAEIGKLSEEQRIKLINNALRGYNPGITLSDTPNMRKRVIDALDGQMAKFYEEPNSAMLSYINQMTETIQARKYFGKGYDMDASIGGIINDMINRNELNIGQAKEASNILKARFNPKGITSSAIKSLRNIGVVTKLANPISTLTQLKDLAYSFYESPTKAPLAMADVIRGEGFKLQDVGIDPLKITEELAEPKQRLKFVQKSMDMTGFTQMDLFGKATLINTIYRKMVQQSRTKSPEFTRRIERYFDIPEEKQAVISDLKSGKKTDSVAFLLFNELSNRQPITMSEMPVGWLKAGNLRISYFLKSFAIRQMDFFLNETLRQIKNPELPKEQRLKATKNLFTLTTAMALVGAGVDEIKEWVLQGETELVKSGLNAVGIEARGEYKPKDTFLDNVADNLLNIFLLSRYDYSQVKRQGAEALTRKVLPPLDFPFDAVLIDLPNILKGKVKNIQTIKETPIIGRPLYEALKKPTKSSSSGFDFNLNIKF